MQLLDNFLTRRLYNDQTTTKKSCCDVPLDLHKQMSIPLPIVDVWKNNLYYEDEPTVIPLKDNAPDDLKKFQGKI